MAIRDDSGGGHDAASPACVCRGAGTGVGAEAFGQAPSAFQARLDTIVKVQEEALQRYAKERSQKQDSAADHYVAAVRKNTDEVLALVRAYPKDPQNVQALKFVIKTARAGPGDESYQAMEILLRDHVRDPGMGEVCGQIFFFVHVPVAESLLRAVLEQNPNRVDRGRACYMLASYLRYQARMVRRIREDPAQFDRFVHERHKAATERFVKQADPEALDRESERAARTGHRGVRRRRRLVRPSAARDDRRRRAVRDPEPVHRQGRAGDLGQGPRRETIRA